MAGPEGGAFYGTPFVPNVDTAGGTIADVPARPLVQVQAGKADPANGGQLVARFGPAPASVAWAVRRITVQASASTRAYVYVGDPAPSTLVAGTRTGDLDEYDANQPIYVPEGTPLCVLWATTTGTALARIEYAEV